VAAAAGGCLLLGVAAAVLPARAGLRGSALAGG